MIYLLIHAYLLPYRTQPYGGVDHSQAISGAAPSLVRLAVVRHLPYRHTSHSNDSDVHCADGISKTAVEYIYRMRVVAPLPLCMSAADLPCTNSGVVRVFVSSFFSVTHVQVLAYL